MFSSALFSLFVSMITEKLLNRLFTEFREKVGRGARKKPLDFGNNPISHYVRVRVVLGLRLAGGTAIVRAGGCYPAFV